MLYSHLGHGDSCCVSLGQHPWYLGFEWGPQMCRNPVTTESAFWHRDRMLAINSFSQERGDFEGFSPWLLSGLVLLLSGL